MTIPNNLILVNGKLTMRDCTSVTAYLKKYNDKLEQDSVAVNIISTEQLTELNNLANLALNWAS